MKDWWNSHKQEFFKGLGSLIAFGSLFFLFQQQSWDEVLDTILKITWSRFFTSLGLLMLSRLFTIARWHILLQSGGVNINLKQTTSITFMGLFASNFLPSTIGGDILRISSTIQLGYDRAICTASVMVDRLVGMAGMALFLPLGIPAFLQESSLLSSNIFFLEKFQKKIKPFLEHIINALRLWQKQPFAIFSALFFSLCHMFSLFFAIEVMINGLGEIISVWTLASLWSLTYFITLLPISVNGYGVQELSLTYFLVNIGGISLSNSLAIALLTRIIIMLASTPGVVFLPSILSTVKKEPSS